MRMHAVSQAQKETDGFDAGLVPLPKGCSARADHGSVIAGSLMVVRVCFKANAQTQHCGNPFHFRWCLGLCESVALVKIN